jgi:UDP-N-acetylglucosamine 2-epimerase
MKPKVVVVIGTRPEAIKMAPVFLALQEQDFFEPVLVSTGQHREMLEQALLVFGLKPQIDLNLMTTNQTLSELTAKIISAITPVFEDLKPAAILVQGDTVSVLGASLAAFYLRIPIGHVEAGLRTRNLDSPWPEEMIRRLTDPICRWCFAPTQWSARNLASEMIPQDRIYVTGNTVIDSLMIVRRKLKKDLGCVEELAERCGISDSFVRRFMSGDSCGRFVLVTGHRRESFGEGFEQICNALKLLVQKYPDLGILYPVHLNPRVQGPVNRILGGNSNVSLVPPLGYADFVDLMDRSYFVMSDSGGVQEEAPSLGKPVLVLRKTTERPEGVAAGTCTLVGTDPGEILAAAGRLIDDTGYYNARSKLSNPFGSGQSAREICEILRRTL